MMQSSHFPVPYLSLPPPQQASPLQPVPAFSTNATTANHALHQQQLEKQVYYEMFMKSSMSQGLYTGIFQDEPCMILLQQMGRLGYNCFNLVYSEIARAKPQHEWYKYMSEALHKVPEWNSTIQDREAQYALRLYPDIETRFRATVINYVMRCCSQASMGSTPPIIRITQQPPFRDFLFAFLKSLALDPFMHSLCYFEGARIIEREVAHMSAIRNALCECLQHRIVTTHPPHHHTSSRHAAAVSSSSSRPPMHNTSSRKTSGSHHRQRQQHPVVHSNHKHQSIPLNNSTAHNSQHATRPPSPPPSSATTGNHNDASCRISAHHHTTTNVPVAETTMSPTSIHHQQHAVQSSHFAIHDASKSHHHHRDMSTPLQQEGHSKSPHASSKHADRRMLHTWDAHSQIHHHSHDPIAAPHGGQPPSSVTIIGDSSHPAMPRANIASMDDNDHHTPSFHKAKMNNHANHHDHHNHTTTNSSSNYMNIVGTDTLLPSCHPALSQEVEWNESVSQYNSQYDSQINQAVRLQYGIPNRTAAASVVGRKKERHTTNARTDTGLQDQIQTQETAAPRHRSPGTSVTSVPQTVHRTENNPLPFDMKTNPVITQSHHHPTGTINDSTITQQASHWTVAPSPHTDHSPPIRASHNTSQHDGHGSPDTLLKLPETPLVQSSAAPTTQAIPVSANSTVSRHHAQYTTPQQNETTAPFLPLDIGAQHHPSLHHSLETHHHHHTSSPMHYRSTTISSPHRQDTGTHAMTDHGNPPRNQYLQEDPHLQNPSMQNPNQKMRNGSPPTWHPSSQTHHHEPTNGPSHLQHNTRSIQQQQRPQHRVTMQGSSAQQISTPERISQSSRTPRPRPDAAEEQHIMIHEGDINDAVNSFNDARMPLHHQSISVRLPSKRRKAQQDPWRQQKQQKQRSPPVHHIPSNGYPMMHPSNNSNPSFAPHAIPPTGPHGYGHMIGDHGQQSSPLHKQSRHYEEDRSNPSSLFNTQMQRINNNNTSHPPPPSFASDRFATPPMHQPLPRSIKDQDDDLIMFDEVSDESDLSEDDGANQAMINTSARPNKHPGAFLSPGW